MLTTIEASLPKFADLQFISLVGESVMTPEMQLEELFDDVAAEVAAYFNLVKA